MAGSRINQRERKSDPVARFGRSVVGLHLHCHRPLHHIGVMPAAPEMPASPPDRTIRSNRPIDFRHMAALAYEASLLHEELAFIFCIRPARSHIIKLGRSGHDIVAAIANLRRPEIWIELG